MKDIYIERQYKLLRIAIKENEKLKECFFEEDKEEPSVGEVYAGMIKNIVPAIKCAFVDIGYKKNCYMYMDSKIGNLNIRKGSIIPVQVLKEESANKGPKVTSAIDLPGRYCAVITINNDINISKKIKDEEYKENCIKNVMKPEDAGVMIRTNAQNVNIEAVNEEIEDLYDILSDIRQKCKRSRKPELIFNNGGILAKLLRDKVDEAVNKIYVDNEKDYHYIYEFMKKNIDVNPEVALYKGQRNLFDCYGIEKEIMALRNNKVMLKCGGYIIIDKTEAMYIIDVNSGKNIKNNSIRKTALNTNMNAAEEIGKQIKLRNLSGIIVIDFIDMNEAEDKKIVLEKLFQAFDDDKNKTVIYPFTELNLVQIARKKVGKCVNDYIEEQCSCCTGSGKRLKFDYIKNLIRNEFTKISVQDNIKDIHIDITEGYKGDIEGDIIDFVRSIDGVDKNIYITYTNKYDYFNVEPLIFTNQVHNLMQYKIYGQ